MFSQTEDLIMESSTRRYYHGAEFLEATVAEVAVGAIEVLAKLLGHGTRSDAYTKKVDDWIKSINERPKPALLQKAQKAIARILAKK